MGGAKAKLGLSPRLSRENRCPPPVKNKSDKSNAFASYTGEEKTFSRVVKFSSSKADKESVG